MDSLELLEKVARAFRDAMYDHPIPDEGWAACKKHWIKDATKFVSLVEAAGLQIVPKE